MATGRAKAIHVFLTKEELHIIQQQFSRLGKTLTQELNLEEFKSVMRGMESKIEVVRELVSDQADVMENLFKLMDVDESNGISMREVILWLAFFQDLERGNHLDEIMFELLDIDRSGTLDANEIRHGVVRIMRAVGRLSVMVDGGDPDEVERDDEALKRCIESVCAKWFSGTRRELNLDEFRQLMSDIKIS
ncbi:hypothetical protein Pelo_13652 [Pelomyxa schiedti]|nr:hypothetical protein Pelo_13652 [Pelomyxa schiedti]